MLNQILEHKRSEILKEREQYVINEYNELILYENGISIRPEIEEALEKTFDFYHGLIRENRYSQLLKKRYLDKCEYLIQHNRFLLLRDRDWRKIFKEINNNKDSFARYYPMVRLDINDNRLAHIVTGIVLNDDLYEYCVKKIQVNVG